jgi:hypothetical protein
MVRSRGGHSTYRIGIQQLTDCSTQYSGGHPTRVSKKIHLLCVPNIWSVNSITVRVSTASSKHRTTFRTTPRMTARRKSKWNHSICSKKKAYSRRWRGGVWGPRSCIDDDRLPDAQKPEAALVRGRIFENKYYTRMLSTQPTRQQEPTDKRNKVICPHD